MGKIMEIMSGIGILIAIYLFLSNAGNTVKIVDSVAGNMLNGIQVLQGRNKLITNE